MRRLYQHIMNTMRQVSHKFDNSMTAQRYDESKPDQCGIVLFSSRNDEECISGELEWECMKLEVYITCSDDATDIFDNIDILAKFVDKFEDCLTDVDGLNMIWAKHLGAKVRPTYTNGYGLQVVKTVIDFNYLYDN